MTYLKTSPTPVVSPEASTESQTQTRTTRTQFIYNNYSGLNIHTFTKAVLELAPTVTSGTDTLRTTTWDGDTIKQFVALLFSSVRLPEWKRLVDLKDGFRIVTDYSTNQYEVIVTLGKVTFLKENEFDYIVAEGVEARSLFEAIAHAKDVIQRTLSRPIEEAVKAAVAPTSTLGEAIVNLEAKKVKTEVGPNITHSHLKAIQGRVLTIVEATFANVEQREAVKSLIKKEFRREMDKVTNGTADSE